MSRDYIPLFRLEVQLVDTTEAMIFLTRVPMSLDSLKNKLEHWEIEMHSEKIPCTPCWVGEAGKKKSVTASLMIQEKRDQNIGMAILPVITQVKDQSNHRCDSQLNF